MRDGPVDPEPTWPGYPAASVPTAYPVPIPAHPQAVTALVLGLVSLVVCPVLGVAAVVAGHAVQRDCDLAPGRWSGRGCGTAGFVLGLVALSSGAFWALMILLAVTAAGG